MKKKRPSVISRHPSHKNFELPLFDKSVRIRFGSLSTFSRVKDIEFPSIDAIKSTSNKVLMKKKFIEHGVSTPIWGYVDLLSLRIMSENAGIPDSLQNLFKVEDGIVVPVCELIFKEKNHSRGEGIMFVASHDDIKLLRENGKEGYLEQVVGNKREFRVHVCDGNAFYIDEKRPRERGHTARIKNLANGYKYREPRKEFPDAVKDEAIKAVNAIGIEFGAVDVSLSEDGTVNVFEVNSAPGMRSRTRKLYNEQLISLIIKKGANLIQ